MTAVAQREWPGCRGRLQPARVDPPPPKLRMAHASLRPHAQPLTDPAAVCVAEVARLYRALEALPGPDNTPRARRSPACVALEQRIRALAAQHWALYGYTISTAARVSIHSTDTSPATALTD